jgi:uroporphyrinogen decarboxylase
MSGKELIKKTFALESVDRPPWVPFVGVHAAALIGVDAETYLHSTELMIKGLNEAIARYHPDGIPVAFDLQLEAEVLGCNLVWNKDNPPSVNSHPLAEGIALADLKVPAKEKGRIAQILEVARTLRSQHPDLALYGLVTGPLTLALHLMGTDVFMKMFLDVQYVYDVMAFCTRVCNAMADYYVEAGCDVIALVDPMCSQIGPEQFKQFVTPYCTKIFEHIKETGAYSSFFVCGQAQHNIEVMCDCKPDNISIDENIPLDYVRDICMSRGISYGGNLKLTVVLLMGNEDDTRRNVVECLDIAGEDYKGFILSPGCDLAYATPTENLVVAGNLVGDKYQQDIVRALESKTFDVVPLDLSNYIENNVVKVDVITLDALACAACQYMWEAVKRACEKFGDQVVCTDHSIKTQEGVNFMVATGVKNIPTTLIDGKVRFISLIPPIKEIERAIEEAFKNKRNGQG